MPGGIISAFRVVCRVSGDGDEGRKITLPHARRKRRRNNLLRKTIAPEFGRK